MLIHSKVGEDVLSRCEEFLDIVEIDPVQAIALDGVMVRNRVVANPLRDKYFQELFGGGLDVAIQATIPIQFQDKLKEVSKKYLYKAHLLDFAKKIGKRK